MDPRTQMRTISGTVIDIDTPGGAVALLDWVKIAAGRAAETKRGLERSMDLDERLGVAFSDLSMLYYAYNQEDIAVLGSMCSLVAKAFANHRDRVSLSHFVSDAQGWPRQFRYDDSGDPGTFWNLTHDPNAWFEMGEGLVNRVQENMTALDAPVDLEGGIGLTPDGVRDFEAWQAQEGAGFIGASLAAIATMSASQLVVVTIAVAIGAGTLMYVVHEIRLAIGDLIDLFSPEARGNRTRELDILEEQLERCAEEGDDDCVDDTLAAIDRVVAQSREGSPMTRILIFGAAAAAALYVAKQKGLLDKV